MSPNILLAWESKHGSTADISHLLARRLRERGIQVTLFDTAKGDKPAGAFDAYILGSAVYRDRWMPHIMQLAHSMRPALLSKPVWLFSSGPLGHHPTPDDSPADIADMFWCTAAREHKIFGGRLKAHNLSLMERANVSVTGKPYGDYRDHGDIIAWGDSIAGALCGSVLGT
ncbi:flavodoxin domain-containing protein [Catelliglobosispora koreensis]|uniref:flavodoxin domain-containing protein n=1 Tax=Catelliglobosispora koreensis TaxID=129052 RepID=UPI0003A6148C|nr:flavodoxin domain-containing protein [Catelliglobosispora koreensis]